MPAISFIVFEDKVLNGTKRMTIRRLWKHPPKVGDKLYLYSHMRTKKCRFLKTAVCSAVEVRRWADMKDDLELAKTDGFDSLANFRNWFIGLYDPTDETKFMIVKW